MQSVTPPESRWSASPSPRFTPLQCQWLLRSGSLTEGLREQGKVTLRVSRESTAELSAQESVFLGAEGGAPIWLREVVMAVDGVDSVFARSFALLVDAAETGAWGAVCGLRTDPLATILYHDPKITRSPFRVAQLSLLDPAYGELSRAFPLACPLPREVLARYSVFTRDARPFLVMECFLPAFWETVSTRCYSPHGAHHA